MKKQKLLLHACCAPCLSAVLERLSPDYELTVFFCNPNIVPLSEYERRLEGVRAFMKLVYPRVPLIAPEYNAQVFASCELCYEYRFAETAKTALVLGIGLFTTTLTLSSRKDADEINAVAARVAREYSLSRLWADFKKADGYNRSIALCREYGLYRQSYCGCSPAKHRKEGIL
ncbi:MAG: epoxyqueuosine reductase QueH [Oscillospiraceae bacterium]|nr:epoxyqueuosine reductase QueH [Oscillospiraceae bacterium]